MPENNDSLTPNTDNLNASDLSSDGINAAPLSDETPHYSGQVDMTGQPIEPAATYDDLPEPDPDFSLASSVEDNLTPPALPEENTFDSSLESGLGEEEPSFNASSPDSLNAASEGAGNSGGGGGRMKFLLLTTGLLMLVLAGAVWFFFLRDDGTPPAPTPTPTPAVTFGATSPTPLAGGPGQTHLECRFGLCVEVPGAGPNMCSSSFDCEEEGGGTTPAPTSAFATPTRAPASTTAPTSNPSPTSALGAPQATNTPTMTPTRTPTPTLSATISPTPLAPVLPESGAVHQTLILSLSSLMLVGGGIALAKRKTE